MLKRKETLDANKPSRIYFSDGFLKKPFGFLFRSMFAFKNWPHVLLENKLFYTALLDSLSFWRFGPLGFS